MQGRGYHQACHQDEQEGWITGQITHTLAKEFPQNMALGGHKRQALFFLLSAHQVACWGQSSTCHCGDCWAHTVDEIGWKKCLPQNACDWVVSDVYRVLSRTGFLEDPLLTSAASRVLWPPCCLKRGAPKINWLNCSAVSPTINSARKVSIRTLAGSGQAPFSQPGLGHEPDRPGLKDKKMWSIATFYLWLALLLFPDSFPRGQCLSVSNDIFRVTLKTCE